MQKTIKRLLTILLCLLIMTTLVPQYAFAISQIDTEKKIDFTVSFVPKKTPAIDVEFKLYKIATVDKHGTFTVTEKYESYPIDFSIVDDTTYATLATTLPGYILEDKLAADYSAKTNADGKAFFEQIDQGLYLVIGDTFKANRSFYIPQPLIICLPALDDMEIWHYEMLAKPKYETRPDDESIDIEVIKVWNDNNNTKLRLKEVTVQLYNGTKLYDTQVLNQENNWKYTWKDMDVGAQWNVKEITEIDGYTVSIVRTQNTFVVYNTRDEEAASPTTPEEDSDTSSKPITPSTPEKDSDTSSKPITPSTPEKLPQTGMLWWPIPVLVAVGLLFIIIGISRRRRSKSEN